MNLEELSIEEQVNYINEQLKTGRTMRDIEVNDFRVNDRVIAKRLTRRGYKRVNDIYILKSEENKNTNEAQKYTDKNNKNKDKLRKSTNVITNPIQENTSVTQMYTKDLDINKLVEVVNLLEPLKEMIEEHNRNKNIIEVQEVVLKPKAIGSTSTKSFRIDDEVLKKWNEFVADHKEFNVQQLISLALEEFINKYK